MIFCSKRNSVCCRHGYIGEGIEQRIPFVNRSTVCLKHLILVSINFYVKVNTEKNSNNKQKSKRNLFKTM